jgi:hypothetical protein
VSALLVCIGSFGPWAKVLFVSANGLDGDGWLTLIAGLAALGLFAVYVRADRRPRPVWPLILILLAGAAAAAVGVSDWSEIEGVVEGSTGEDNPLDVEVSVGWGLVLVTIAGISLVLSAIAVIVRRGQEPGPTTPEQPAEPVAPEPPASEQ